MCFQVFILKVGSGGLRLFFENKEADKGKGFSGGELSEAHILTIPSNSEKSGCLHQPSLVALCLKNPLALTQSSIEQPLPDLKTPKSHGPEISPGHSAAAQAGGQGQVSETWRDPRGCRVLLTCWGTSRGPGSWSLDSPVYLHRPLAGFCLALSPSCCPSHCFP